MNKVFSEIFKYGFHDTEITSISIDKNDIQIFFENGLYLLDDSGKETTLTGSIILILSIESSFNEIENCFEIREFGKKIKYVDIQWFQNQLKREPYSISMHYYSKFNDSILFDGGFLGKQVILSIEEIGNIKFIKAKK